MERLLECDQPVKVPGRLFCKYCVAKILDQSNNTRFDGIIERKKACLPFVGWWLSFYRRVSPCLEVHLHVKSAIMSARVVVMNQQKARNRDLEVGSNQEIGPYGL